MLSGGSIASTSLIPAARTVTVQTAPFGRFDVGSSVIVEPGEPLTVNACAEPVGHSSVNELPLAVTGSLKLTSMFAFLATSIAPSAGVGVRTLGAAAWVGKRKSEFRAGWLGGGPASGSLMFA